MINENFQRYYCNGRGYHPARDYMHVDIDLRGVVWADSTGYMGNLFLLWLGLVMAAGSWNLVARDIP